MAVGVQLTSRPQPARLAKSPLLAGAAPPRRAGGDDARRLGAQV